MKKVLFILFSVIALLIFYITIRLFVPDLNICVLYLCFVIYIYIKIISYTTIGKYFLSVARGLYWGVQLRRIPYKFRCEKDVTIFNPRSVSFGKSCNIGTGAVLAPLGGGILLLSQLEIVYI